MVYWLIERNPYSTITGMSTIDQTQKEFFQADFLHPEEADRVSRITYAKMTTGYAMNPDDMAKKVRWESKSRAVPDVAKCYGTLLISERVRDIMEQFEPGVHQFLPVDLYRPKADEPFARYYWLIITQRIDSVDAEHTTYGRMGIRKDGIWDLNGDPEKNIYHSLSAIGDHHMWIDPYIGGAPKLSDALGDALIEAGVTGAFFEHIEQI